MIRAASLDDLAVIAAIGEACGVEPTESAQDEPYVRHLLAVGQVVVDEAGTGFAATVDVGGVTMLCDLFVRPEARSRGLGDQLLRGLFDGPRMTFSSQDPRALALYLRHGMTPRWPLLYLSGPAVAIDGPFEVVPVTADQAAIADETITSISREATYAYWSTRPGAGCFIVRDAGTTVGAGCRGEGVLIHLAAAASAPSVLMSALAALSGRLSLCVPGSHATALVAAGFRIDDFDVFFTSGPDPLDHGLVVMSPGLV